MLNRYVCVRISWDHALIRIHWLCGLIRAAALVDFHIYEFAAYCWYWLLWLLVATYWRISWLCMGINIFMSLHIDWLWICHDVDICSYYYCILIWLLFSTFRLTKTYTVSSRCIGYTPLIHGTYTLNIC